MEGTKQGLCLLCLQAGPVQVILTLHSCLHLGCLSPINQSFGHPRPGGFWVLCQGLVQNPGKIPLLQHFSQCDVFGGSRFGQQTRCTGMSPSVPLCLLLCHDSGMFSMGGTWSKELVAFWAILCPSTTSAVSLVVTIPPPKSASCVAGMVKPHLLSLSLTCLLLHCLNHRFSL